MNGMRTRFAYKIAAFEGREIPSRGDWELAAELVGTIIDSLSVGEMPYEE